LPVFTGEHVQILWCIKDELGSVPVNRTCGHSTSAWCQLGNGLRIVNGGSGQWKRLRSRLGHALDDDDDDDKR